MEREPVIAWPRPFFELAGFLVLFLSAGAIGFRFAVLRRLAPQAAADAPLGAVLTLGAWNWRRQPARLGRDGGALALRSSATAELFAALAVLVITALLLSTPDPH